MHAVILDAMFGCWTSTPAARTSPIRQPARPSHRHLQRTAAS